MMRLTQSRSTDGWIRLVVRWGMLLLTLGCLSDLQADTLTIGTINHAPVREIRQFSPLATHLVNRLGTPDLREGRVVIAEDIPRMVELMRNGQIDLYFDSPLPSLAVNHLSGSEMVLRRWKHEIATYSSVIVVREDSPIRSLADLPGHVIGFKDAFSSSGYLLPHIVLNQAGFSLVPADILKENPHADQVGYRFTQGNENTIVWVLYGKIDAGAIALDELQTKARSERNRLRVIHETMAIPRHVVNFRSGMPETLKRRLIDLLVTLDQEESGRQVLKKFESTTRFDPIPVELGQQLEAIRPMVLKLLGMH